jgi:CMP-N-acetylneuraminic acid synthetase
MKENANKKKEIIFIEDCETSNILKIEYSQYKKVDFYGNECIRKTKITYHDNGNIYIESNTFWENENIDSKTV